MNNIKYLIIISLYLEIIQIYTHVYKQDFINSLHGNTYNFQYNTKTNISYLFYININRKYNNIRHIKYFICYLICIKFLYKIKYLFYMRFSV